MFWLRNADRASSKDSYYGTNSRFEDLPVRWKFNENLHGQNDDLKVRKMKIKSWASSKIKWIVSPFFELSTLHLEVSVIVGIFVLVTSSTLLYSRGRKAESPLMDFVHFPLFIRLRQIRNGHFYLLLLSFILYASVNLKYSRETTELVPAYSIYLPLSGVFMPSLSSRWCGKEIWTPNGTS